MIRNLLTDLAILAGCILTVGFATFVWIAFGPIGLAVFTLFLAVSVTREISSWD